MRRLPLVFGFLGCVAFLIFIAGVQDAGPVGELRDWLGPNIFDPVVAMLLALSLLATGFAVEAPRLEASKEIAFVAMVVALGAAGRILFAPAPNISPVDWLTLCTGIVFGPATGFTVGASMMLVSNFYLGQGPWTAYQMVGMGLLGFVGGLLGYFRKTIGKKVLALTGFLWGLIYGIITSFFWVLITSSVLSWASFGAYLASGLIFFILQGIGNAVLLLFLGERTLRVFERFNRRLSVEFREAEEEVTYVGAR